MTKNLFVLFAPGLGGNHLANIFSLDPTYRERSFGLENYSKPWPTVHDNISLEPDSIRNNLELLIGKNNVFCGHWATYLQCKNSGLLDHFPNRIFCTILMPEVDSDIYHRLLHFNPGATPWLYSEVGWIYRRPHMENLIDEKPSTFVYAWPHLLYNNDIKPLIDDVKSQGLDINPDLARAQHYHNLWLSKNSTENLTYWKTS